MNLRILMMTMLIIIFHKIRVIIIFHKIRVMIIFYKIRVMIIFHKIRLMINLNKERNSKVIIYSKEIWKHQKILKTCFWYVPIVKPQKNSRKKCKYNKEKNIFFKRIKCFKIRMTKTYLREKNFYLINKIFPKLTNNLNNNLNHKARSKFFRFSKK